MSSPNPTQPELTARLHTPDAMDSMIPGSDGGAAPVFNRTTCADLLDASDDLADGPRTTFRSEDRGFTSVRLSNLESDLRNAQAAANLCERFVAMRSGGLSGNQAAKRLGKSPAWFSINVPKWQRGGVAALLPDAREPGAQAQLFTDLPGWFIPACQFFYLLTNRTAGHGSVPEAIRCAISLPACVNAVKARLMRKLGVTQLPECPIDLRETILQREKEGKLMLTSGLMKEIACNPVAALQHRNPTEASLANNLTSGTAMWFNDPETFERRPVRAGDILEADDASINFPVCVEWKIGGDPCSDKYGVKVGRFQWLRTIDVASRFKPGYIFVCRPRESYRAEDILALMRGIVRQHGIFREGRFERGSWESNRVKEAFRVLGMNLHTVFSPRSKPYIEGSFNQSWTKLSVHFPQSYIGRFMGETEEANMLLTACKQGRKDPRNYFPMLSDAMAAFDTVTREEHQTPVFSRHYGSWVPAERWAAQITERPLRKFDRDNDWIFAPYRCEWRIKGMMTGGMVPLFDDCSIPFNFSAPWMAQFDGARVAVYFDPFEPQCRAKVVLSSASGNHKPGEILGDAWQVDEVATYARYVLGYGDEANQGLRVKRANATALRREVRTILGKTDTVREVEVRDGLGSKLTLSSDGNQSETTSRECDEPTDGLVRFSRASAGRSADNHGSAPVDDDKSSTDRFSRLKRAEEVENQIL
jgi:hypothetical protein